jgi:hypothetical protein
MAPVRRALTILAWFAASDHRHTQPQFALALRRQPIKHNVTKNTRSQQNQTKRINMAKYTPTMPNPRTIHLIPVPVVESMNISPALTTVAIPHY